MKIGPVDTEIALLIVKKEEITEGKIYSPVGKFAERAKKGTAAEHIVDTPSGGRLNTQAEIWASASESWESACMCRITEILSVYHSTSSLGLF